MFRSDSAAWSRHCARDALTGNQYDLKKLERDLGLSPVLFCWWSLLDSSRHLYWPWLSGCPLRPSIIFCPGLSDVCEIGSLPAAALHCGDNRTLELRERGGGGGGGKKLALRWLVSAVWSYFVEFSQQCKKEYKFYHSDVTSDCFIVWSRPDNVHCIILQDKTFRRRMNVENSRNTFGANLMEKSLSFESPLTRHSCNTLKCVWELTKEVKQLIFSRWLLSLLHCLYLGAALKWGSPLCEMLILIMPLAEG